MLERVLQTDTATMENSMEIPLKTRNRTTIWPNNPTTGHKPWGNNSLKRYMYPNVHCSNIYGSQDKEETHWGMDKEDVVHISNWILLNHKKRNNIPCSNTDGPRSQSDNGKNKVGGWLWEEKSYKME